MRLKWQGHIHRAYRLGGKPDLALILGHAVAGLGARAKARSLGIIKEQDRDAEKRDVRTCVHRHHPR
jgi:hypothetical protein